MTSRALRKVLVALVVSAATVALGGCGSQEDPIISAPPFALTDAVVTVVEGRDYPVNFIFVAQDRDPIWDDLNGISVAGEDYSAEQFQVIRGEGTNGMHLGNIAIDVQVPDGGFTFDTVSLDYDGAHVLLAVPVGSWTFDTAPESEFVATQTGAEVASMSGCTSAELPLPSEVEALDSFETGSALVSATSAELALDGSTVSFALECSDDMDFYIVSPTAQVMTDDGQSQAFRFAPISIGYQDIDNADIRRIGER